MERFFTQNEDAYRQIVKVSLSVEVQQKPYVGNNSIELCVE